MGTSVAIEGALPMTEGPRDQLDPMDPLRVQMLDFMLATFDDELSKTVVELAVLDAR
jgi:hypothetical protein